jgi:hypothetical protein
MEPTEERAVMALRNRPAERAILNLLVGGERVDRGYWREAIEALERRSLVVEGELRATPLGERVAAVLRRIPR